jgi:hypothetical protein
MVNYPVLLISLEESEILNCRRKNSVLCYITDEQMNANCACVHFHLWKYCVIVESKQENTFRPTRRETTRIAESNAVSRYIAEAKQSRTLELHLYRTVSNFAAGTQLKGPR